MLRLVYQGKKLKIVKKQSLPIVRIELTTIALTFWKIYITHILLEYKQKEWHIIEIK